MDSHIREYWDLDRTYAAHVDPKYREKYEDLSRAVKSQQKAPGDVGLGDVLWPLPPRHPMGVYDAFEAERYRYPGGEPTIGAGTGPVTTRGQKIDPACHWDPSIRMRDMDVAGIDASVMFPSQSDGLCMLNDVGFEAAMHWAYHRFMSNYCAESDGRLRWVADSTIRDIPETIKQLEYWTKNDPHFAGMFIPRACPDGTMLDNPILHPLFAASQELDQPIWVHGGANRPPYTPWVSAPNALYHGWGGQYALSGLIGGGVFDLFPKLRIGIFESGCGWMPWLIEQLDDGYRPGSTATPRLQRKPSEIVASGQLFCAVEPDEGLIGQAVEHLGEDFLLFSTDYPHGGSSWPDGVPMITDRTELSESAKVKLLCDNALRFMPKLA
jgi:hypothetical protein